MDKTHSTLNLSDIFLGIVCPMANEIDSCQDFVSSVLTQCTGFKQVFFYAVLDNKSTDGTFDSLKQMEQQVPELKVIWSPENRCVVDAYMRGYKEALQAGCDWILEIDAGYSHQPADIPGFIEKMSEGYDCVFGSRFCKGASTSKKPLKRFIISYGGTVLINLLLGTKLTDMTSGFEMFTHQSLTDILDKGIQSKAHFFQTEIKTHAQNMTITEVPIHYRCPSNSVNNNVLKDAFINLFRLFKLRLKHIFKEG